MSVQKVLDSKKFVEKAEIRPDAPISEALSLLAERNVSALIVSNDGESLDGIITERDIVRGLNETGAATLETPVSELMTEEVITCIASDELVNIMSTMIDKHLRHMPVLEDGKYVAMLSIRDLLQLRLNEVQYEADAMRTYIAGKLA